MSDPATALDLTDSTLVTGRISIVASAGTGKTYSLTVLVARHVAEQGLRPDQLLLVTFTNEATRELVQRTRERCQEALDALRGNGPVTDWMAPMHEPGVRATAEANLHEFLSRYDEVTISTIHSFCHGVLRRAGLSAGAASDAEIETESGMVLDQVVADLVVGELSRSPGSMTRVGDERGAGGTSGVSSRDVASSVGALRAAARKVLDNYGAIVLPRPPGRALATDPGRLSGKNRDKDLATLAHAETIADRVRDVVAAVRARTAERGVITHNDMIRLVADALVPPGDDEAARARAGALAADLARQHTMIMVDEFQDTDELQWRIFDAIHRAGEGECTLVMVGDPKQAIYRFRGADVDVYLGATETAEATFRLDTNYRSDGPLLVGLEALLAGQTYDRDGTVAFESVRADPNRLAHGLGRVDAGAPPTVPGTPIELRVIGVDPLLTASDEATTNNGERAVRLFLRDMANHVVELLDHGTIATDDGDGSGGGRAVVPRDIAVLVNSHADAEKAVRALGDVGVGAVRLRTGNVFESPAARHWLMMLECLGRPGRRSALRGLALSWFGGLSEHDLALANREVDPAIDDSEAIAVRAAREALAACERVSIEAAELLRREGVIGAYLSFRNDESFLARVLGSASGDRDITDLDHIAEHLAGVPRFARGAGALDVLEELRSLVADADDEDAREVYQRRIDSDADAVTVLTVHSSKGLQFPIVFLPALVRLRNTTGAHPRTFPLCAPGGPTRRALDVASGFGAASKWRFLPAEFDASTPATTTTANRKDASTADADWDFRRQLYVALTRAQHKLICYWSPTGRNRDLPFETCLRRSCDVAAIPRETSELLKTLHILENASDGAVSVVELAPVVRPKPIRRPAVPTPPATLAAAAFSRDHGTLVSPGHGRWSYSAIVRALTDDTIDAHHRHATVEPGGATDEGFGSRAESTASPDPDPSSTQVDDPAATEFPWRGIPAGAAIGTVVHSILDHVDPASTTLPADLDAALTRHGAGWRGLDRRRLREALLANVRSPLGGAMGDATLASLGAVDRLSELRFDFPLPDDRGITATQISSILKRHVDVDGRIARYADELLARDAEGLSFGGFMNGSIDAVFRLGDGGDARYFVCDYKTNRLHDERDPAPLRAYTHDRLEDAVCEADYVIQMLVYSVALHRYLRWRVADYDHDLHFGGVVYLFLRGLIGRSVDARPPGAYHWRPGRAMIEELDELFATGGGNPR